MILNDTRSIDDDNDDGGDDDDASKRHQRIGPASGQVNSNEEYHELEYKHEHE